MQKVLPLSDRVRAALSEPTTSDAVKALIEAAGFELEAVRQRLQSAKAKAVDPMSTDTEAADARREHHDLGFEEERQTSSIARLKHRLTVVIGDEDQKRKRAAYDALMQDHAKLCEKLTDRYPVLAGELVSLLTEVEEMNARTKAVNNDRPTGAQSVLSVDDAARGPVSGTYTGWSGGEAVYTRPVSLLRGVHLPKFIAEQAKSQDGYLWHGLLKAD